MKFKIAVVQFAVKEHYPEFNIKRAEKFIKKASASKAKIIVFPEDFITGPIEKKKELADTNNSYRNHFQTLAKKYKIDIVAGSIIEKESSGRYHNITYYIDAKGEVKGKYQKNNLWHTEKGHFTPGTEVTVCDTRYGKIGLSICWDLVYPEVYREMFKKGVDIVISPSYWCYGDAGKGLKYDKNSEINLVNAFCMSRAIENEVIFVYCNTAEKFGKNSFKHSSFGHSQITVPFKGALKKLAHNREAMFIQEVDTNILKDVEKSYLIKHDSKHKSSPK